MALSLEAYGHSAHAQKLYLELISQENSGRGVGLKLSSFELELWEGRWIECARQLAQWPLLADLGKASKQQDLSVEVRAGYLAKCLLLFWGVNSTRTLCSTILRPRFNQHATKPKMA